MRAARSASVIAILLALVGAACSSSGKSAGTKPTSTVSTTSPPAPGIAWPAPADPMVRARAAGLVPETAERLQYHVHAHLDLFVNGQPVTVPAGLGINIHDPGVHSSNDGGAIAYGGISVPCKQACISPLHTHDVSGVLHTESSTRKNNTLGQLFTEWAVKLDANCVSTYCRPTTKIGIYIDGRPFTGDPRTIALADRREIAIVIGTAPATIPSQSGI